MQMAKKRFPMATVVALTIVGLVLTLTAYGAVTVSTTLSSSGSITTSANIGLYSDSACTTSLTTIDWGTTSPGSSITRTVYVKNTGTGVSLTLGMTTGNWSPSGANGPITLTWNREGTVLTPGQSVAAVLTLSVSSGITGITSFSVQILISGSA
jgi:hypothetical protein